MPSVPSEPTDLRRRGRQRLLGAVALALVAAVVVPMVLDEEQRPAARDPVAAIPDRNQVAPLSAPEPPPPGAEARIAAAPEAAPATPAASVAPSPVTPAIVTPAVVTPVPAPPAAPAAAPTPPAKPPALAGFAVQAGAFRDDARLAQARKKLTSAGIRHYTERVPGDGGELTRLRAGPFADRQAAAAAAAEMKAAGLGTSIVTLP